MKQTAQPASNGEGKAAFCRKLSMNESCELALATFAAQMRSLGGNGCEQIAEYVERQLQQIPLEAAESARRWADPLGFVEVRGRRFRKTESRGQYIFTSYFLLALVNDLWTWYRHDETIAPFLPEPFGRRRLLSLN